MNKTFHASQLRQTLVYLRSSLWFVPSVLIFVLALLALGLVELDQQIDASLRKWWPRMFVMEAEGARAMLTTIASSMATIAGVAFSITVVALALASTQYSSRVLRNFMRDRANQVVLGVFVGVYLYCLLVTRTISSNGETFVPAIAALAGLVLATVAICFFIFFIHHVSTSIQASEIVAAITRETREALGKLFSESLNEPEDHENPAIDESDGTRWHPVPARRFGYVQRVEPGELLRFAEDLGVTVRMDARIGDFVIPGQALVSITSENAPPDALANRIDMLFAIASYRTIEQDPSFGIRQLVDIALKALSPSVNDTTTAVTCIEHLAFLLSECIGRCPVRIYSSPDGKACLLTRSPGFEQLLSLSFAQILENAEGNTEILTHALLALTRIAERPCIPRRLLCLKQWVEVVAQIGRRSARSDHAARVLEQQLAVTSEVLSTKLARTSRP